MNGSVEPLYSVEKSYLKFLALIEKKISHYFSKKTSATGVLAFKPSLMFNTIKGVIELSFHHDIQPKFISKIDCCLLNRQIRYL